ncbi:NAD(P)-binding domain-containing protein [Streptomyces sp. NPDC026672]|uniref:NADPH-dependent F420 reductase n=1 Tax=unclassified Streptomyces TaxID=2593676 RepID=UPI0033C7CFA6
MTTLGFIGSGLMAREIARLAVAAGVEVVLSNRRGPESLADLVAELGPLASAADTAGAAKADVVVLAAPLGNLPDLDPALFQGKPVLDITNYYPHRDGRIAELDSGSVTIAQYVQGLLPDARTVRVFSNISYHHIPRLARPAGASDRSALPLAGDDPETRATLAALTDRLGYDTVDTGDLTGSWRFEPNTIAYLTPYASPELKSLADLRTTPAAPLPAKTLTALLAAAERTDQAAREF